MVESISTFRHRYIIELEDNDPSEWASDEWTIRDYDPEFIEFSQKADYARYSHLKIYEGTAKQNFGTYELILSIGAIVPTTKHNPIFHPEKKG